jgi:hypothetical protein
MADGIRHRHPHLGDPEVVALLRAQIERLRTLEAVS